MGSLIALMLEMHYQQSGPDVGCVSIDRLGAEKNVWLMSFDASHACCAVSSTGDGPARSLTVGKLLFSSQKRGDATHSGT